MATTRRRRASWLVLVSAGLLLGCGDDPSGPAALGESWIRATGSDAARGNIDFAANAFVTAFSGRQVVSAADGSGIGFSLSFDPASVSIGTDELRLLGLTYPNKSNRPGAFTPITGGVVRFTAIGAAPGDAIEGTFRLDVDRAEDASFARIQLQASGSFRFLRK
jgi:hypothetical protein